MGMPKQRQEPGHRRDEIAEDLRDRITAGREFPPGGLIPSGRELAAQYRCAPMTAQAALRILAEDGVITIRPRQGSIVALPAPSIAGPMERMRRASRGEALLRPGESAELLSARLVEAPPDPAGAFGVTDDGLVGVREYVVRSATGVVVTYGRSYFPRDVWAGVPELAVTEPIRDGAIGAIGRAFGRVTTAVPTWRAAEFATEDEARVLGVDEGEPVLVEVTECQQSDGTVVEYAVQVHPRGYRVGR